MLARMLSRIAKEYTYERAKPYANSRFGDFVRHDVVVESKKQILLLPYDLKVKASVGAGNWASVPWLAYFDPLITESATKGFYVVFLINTKDETVVLSMNQGTTAIYTEYGQSRGREVLKRRAIDIAERVPEYAKLFSKLSITLGSTDSLPLSYEAGHSFGRTYMAGAFSEEQLSKDLENMLEAYETLVDRGGTIPTDVMHDEADSKDIEETRKYVLSRRIERSARVRRDVLAVKAPVCECCGLAPFQDYSFFSEKEGLPLDIHHAKPLNELAEGETKRYRIPDDFLVLCPTCHRMIHKQSDPSDLQALKDRLKYILAREI